MCEFFRPLCFENSFVVGVQSVFIVLVLLSGFVFVLGSWGGSFPLGPCPGSCWNKCWKVEKCFVCVQVEEEKRISLESVANRKYKVFLGRPESK